MKELEEAYDLIWTLWTQRVSEEHDPQIVGHPALLEARKWDIKRSAELRESAVARVAQWPEWKKKYSFRSESDIPFNGPTHPDGDSTDLGGD